MTREADLELKQLEFAGLIQVKLMEKSKEIDEISKKYGN